MARLEELVHGVRVRGLAGDAVATVQAATPFGSHAVNVVYRIDATGQTGDRLVYHSDATVLEIVAAASQWAFDAPGDRFRLALEATRLRLAHLFDPLLALSTSQVEALPHQISAVYEQMLHRQPLRFLLADDPGAGKTIMAGLLIKELLLRGDVERCLIVVPASLDVQWQDELWEKFKLDFKLLGRGEIESATTNAFAEHNLAIARIDLLKQDEQMERLAGVEWDLVVVDEAHKMSATYDPSGERRLTARYHLGQALAERTRHFLLMTATPHRGKEADFQLFLALLDGDRFEGRYRREVHHAVDVSDLMRRLLKEEMVDFDGHKLFPDRFAYTVNYDLSPREEELYEAVTHYVSEEMNRADVAAQQEGGQGARKRAIVGFALTTLQRRLASSPNAIYRSLERRRKRLEATLIEVKQPQEAARMAALMARLDAPGDLRLGKLANVGLDELADDLEDRPEEEQNAVVDAASAARSVPDLEREVTLLRRLERQARECCDQGEDSKWVELRRLLQDREEMFEEGKRLKLVVFTEHKDTLDYLHGKIATLLGDPEAVVIIHGALGRDARRESQERFVNDQSALVLLATDAAGEGINLQRAHLMVNYDLPWNPNRIEQRFGRIHRFGQREDCHLWNLVAHTTREGAVFRTLLDKLEVERAALGGRVFDVLGTLFEGQSLRDLLMKAIRHGDRPEVQVELEQAIAEVAGREHFERVLAEQALNTEQFGTGRLSQVKDLMQRAAVNRLVPHFVASFFQEAFASLGGSASQREPGRFQITHVPAELRQRHAGTGGRTPLLRRYDRICFAKDDIRREGRPDAQFVAPGHPLLDATISAVREREGGLLRRGAILVDPRSEVAADEPRVLFALRHDITDGHILASGERRVIASELHFVELDAAGRARGTVQAPYLDYEPLPEAAHQAILAGAGETAALAALVDEWRGRDLEGHALAHAVEHLVPPHLGRVRVEREALVQKAMAAVHERLTKEIIHWHARAEELREQELAGKKPRLNSERARERAEALAARLQRRLAELRLERETVPKTPVAIAGALVVPARLVAPWLPAKRDRDRATTVVDPEARRRTELIAMRAVIEWERARGYEPQDVSDANLGYDVESRDPLTDRLRFIEVKGRDSDADTLTVTRNECMAGLNLRGDFWLAIVRVKDDHVESGPHYVQDPIAAALSAEPRFGLVSVQLDIDKVLARA